MSEHDGGSTAAPPAAGDASSLNDQFYARYLDFKSEWGNRHDAEHREYFDRIPALAKLPRNANLLEIGFGDGQFLRWGRQAGHNMVGVEIIPELVARARADGIPCFLGPLEPGALGERRFDAIIAFDVLEHLEIEQIIALVTNTRDHLDPTGFYLFRFPNAESPFGLGYQHGDITHRTALSAAMMTQIAQATDLRVAAIPRPRPYPRSLGRRLKRAAGYAVQVAIERLLAFAYFGGEAHLEPNLLVILRKAPARPSP
jgi:2-polyprenyl-3-methyl-5-hydroxy-6-metoxy-1,4-benzoquinol methylase